MQNNMLNYAEAIDLTQVRQLVSQNIIAALLAAALLGTLTTYYNSKNKQRYWSKRGVKGPKPWAFFGNYFAQTSGNRLKKELDWVREHGKVYGVFDGNIPRLIVADVDILQQICTRDFETFPNHDLSGFQHKYSNSFLSSLQDEHWKRTRALLTPTFTSSKMKRMFRFMDGCADDLVQCFRDQLSKTTDRFEGSGKGGVLQVKDLYSLFTMDAIATCCYGLKLQRAAGSTSLKMVASRDDFVASAMEIFQPNVWRLFIGLTFPKALLKLMDFKIISDSQLDPLDKKVKQLVSKRKGSQKKFDDFLQLLIDARLDDQLELNEMDTAENHHAGLTHESLLKDQKDLINGLKSESGKRITLSDFEVLSSAMFILVVGLETTGSLLAHCSYALAFHPEIQDRLYEELMKIAQFDAVKNKFYFDYESLTSCKYLDACISETLRVLPVILQIDRKSKADYFIEKYNLKLPRGTKLNLAYYAIMNDPDYWPQPERFNPDRFMPGAKDKIVPGSYCPFGLGPRHCIGMRFSLTESKLALAKMVLNFRFEPAAGTEFPPEPKIVILREPSTIIGGLKNTSVKVSERR